VRVIPGFVLSDVISAVERLLMNPIATVEGVKQFADGQVARGTEDHKVVHWRAFCDRHQDLQGPMKCVCAPP
jgi:hypothetical protein